MSQYQTASQMKKDMENLLEQTEGDMGMAMCMEMNEKMMNEIEEIKNAYEKDMKDIFKALGGSEFKCYMAVWKKSEKPLDMPDMKKHLLSLLEDNMDILNQFEDGDLKTEEDWKDDCGFDFETAEGLIGDREDLGILLYREEWEDEINYEGDNIEEDLEKLEKLEELEEELERKDKVIADSQYSLIKFAEENKKLKEEIKGMDKDVVWMRLGKLNREAEERKMEIEQSADDKDKKIASQKETIEEMLHNHKAMKMNVASLEEKLYEKDPETGEIMKDKLKADAIAKEHDEWVKIFKEDNAEMWEEQITARELRDGESMTPTEIREILSITISGEIAMNKGMIMEIAERKRLTELNGGIMERLRWEVDVWMKAGERKDKQIAKLEEEIKKVNAEETEPEPEPVVEDGSWDAIYQ